MSKAASSDALVARPARPDDFTAYLALFPELGVDEAPLDADAWALHMAPQTLVFELAGAVVGYIYFQILASEGYVRHVIVHPEHRARGLGLRMMSAVAERLRAAGCTRWRLNVKPDNAAALALYHRVGMRVAHRSAAVRLTWSTVDRLPDSDMSFKTCPIDPADDDALEATFELPRGQLAGMRADPRRVNLRLRDPAAPQAPLGLACFAPHFPGAFPFRVTRPGLARPLLAGMRPHALPEHDRVQLVIEDDDELRRHLLAVGAELHMEFLHLLGPVPP